METLDRGPVIISLHGAFDITARESLQRELAPAEAAQRAVVDLSDVSYAGTTLLNALLSLRKRMRRNDAAASITLVGANDHIRKILTITRLDRIFTVD